MSPQPNSSYQSNCHRNTWHYSWLHTKVVMPMPTHDLIFVHCTPWTLTKERRYKFYGKINVKLPTIYLLNVMIKPFLLEHLIKGRECKIFNKYTLGILQGQILWMYSCEPWINIEQWSVIKWPLEQLISCKHSTS